MSEPAQNSVLQIRNYSLDYLTVNGVFHALKNIDLEIAAGDSRPCRQIRLRKNVTRLVDHALPAG